VRLAIISDIHEDFETLKKILLKAEKKGFDQLICLGDISGFSLPYYKYGRSRNASACLALVREKCDIVIAGNHDLHAAGLSPDLPEELKEKEVWQHEADLDPGYSEDDISFLLTLPGHAILNTSEFNILFSHYVYPNLTGFVKGFYSWEKEFKAHFAFMREHECKLCFTGHAHPRGFYMVHPDVFNQYRYRTKKNSSFPAIIGIPPVTRHKHRSGFCIFDTESLNLQALR